MDEINFELQILANEEREGRIQEEYDRWLDEMEAEHQMMMYACHSYDEDAIFYGAH